MQSPSPCRLRSLASIVCLLTTTGLAILGSAMLLPIRDNGGTLLGGMAGEYSLYLLLLVWTQLILAWLVRLPGVRTTGLGIGCVVAMLAIGQWLLYPDDQNGQRLLSPNPDELWNLVITSLFLTSPLLLRAPPIPKPLLGVLAVALILLCGLSLYLLTSFLGTGSGPSECLDDQQRQVSLCID